MCLSFSPMWYRPIQSVASTSSLMSQEITMWVWPRVSWYVDAVSDERLSDVTRSVSLLARWSPTVGVSDWLPGEISEGEEDADSSTAPVEDRPWRLSGPMVYGRVCGVRRRTASRCSRALLLPGDEGGGEEEAVAAIAMAPSEEWPEKGGEDWWWW